MSSTYYSDKKRYASKLAEALTVLHRIPPGRELVFLLGTGAESSNFDAVVSWTSHQLEALTPDVDQWVFNEISRSFLRKMQQIQDELM